VPINKTEIPAMKSKPFFNFPRPMSDPEKFRQILRFGQKIDTRAGWNDEELGDVLLAEKLYVPRGNPPLEQYRQQYENRSKSLKPWISFARECNRFLSLMGFVERIASLKGRYRPTQRGIKLGQMQGQFPQELERDLWTYALANLKLYSINDERTRQDRGFKVRPYLLILRMLKERALNRNEMFVTAFTRKTESDDDIANATQVLAAIDGEPAALDAQLNSLSATRTTADNNTKLLPTFAWRLQHISRYSGMYQLEQLGIDFLSQMFEYRPIWFDDIPAPDNQRQQVASLLLALNATPLAKADLPASLLPIDSPIDIIRRMNIPLSDDGQNLKLDVPLSFDFYQDIPPEVRQSPDFRSLLTDLNWQEDVVHLPEESATSRSIVDPKRPRRRSVRRRTSQRRKIDVAVKRSGKVETGTAQSKTVIEYDPEVLQERTREHESVVAEFTEFFERQGFTCYEGNFDFLAEHSTEALLLEMKTIDPRNEREQIIKAIGQLDYYGYFDAPDSVESDKPIWKGIVLSRTPTPEHVEFLRSLDTYVFWLDENGEIRGEEESLQFLENFCGSSKTGR
jgi:hypothetical protein